MASGIPEICFLERGPCSDSVDGLAQIEDTPGNVAGLVSDGWSLIIGIAEPGVRKRIAERYTGCPFVSVAHPSATFGVGQREIFDCSAGSSACAGARLANHISVGNHVVVHANATIGHDSILGDFASIMPGANVSGNVRLHDRVYLGTGSAIINGANDRFLDVGAGAIVGAGAVVICDIPAEETWVGVPARAVRK